MAKKTLTGVVETPNTGIACLPDVGPIVVHGPDVTQSAYVTFAHPNSKVWPKLCQAIQGVEENDTCLILPEPQRPAKLSPCRFMLLAASQFWGQFDPVDFELVRARRDPPVEGEKRDWKEQIETVVLVFHGDRLVPASLGFRTVKCAAAHRAIEAGLLAANTEEWGKQSAEHKLTVGVPVYWARFVAQIKVGGKKSSKSSGFSYTPVTSLIFPSSGAELKLLSESFASDEFKSQLDSVRERYEHKVSEVNSLCV